MKCGNKAVGKRSLIIVEQFGPNPQTKNNNFLFSLTMWAVNLALSFLAARSKLKDTKCFLSQYSKTRLCQSPVNCTIEDTGEGVELFWGEVEITRSLRGMGVWLSRIRVARAKGRESGSGDHKVRIQHAGFLQVSGFHDRLWSLSASSSLSVQARLSAKFKRSTHLKPYAGGFRHLLYPQSIHWEAWALALLLVQETILSMVYKVLRELLGQLCNLTSCLGPFPTENIV